MLHRSIMAGLFVFCAHPAFCMENKNPQETILESKKLECIASLKETLRKTTELPYPKDGGGTQFYPLHAQNNANGNSAYGPQKPFQVHD